LASTTSTVLETALRAADAGASSLATWASVGAIERTRTGTNVAVSIDDDAATASNERRRAPAPSLDAHQVNVRG
jgi:hypothetical protein